MKKKLFLALSVAIFALFVKPQYVLARVITSERSVMINSSEVIDDDLYISGEKVTVNGTINGDLYAAGGVVTVTGTINGDVYAGGGNITISAAKISQDLTVAGGNVSVLETQVGDSLSAFGGNILVKGGEIKGGVNFGGGSGMFDTPIGRGFMGGAGTVTLNAPVGKDVFIGTDDLTLGEKARIGGDLNYYSEKPAELNEASQVNGKVNFVQSEEEAKQNSRRRAMSGGYAGMQIWRFLTNLFIGFVLILLLPKFTRSLATSITAKPLSALGWGTLKLLLILPVVILTAVTIIGLQFAAIIVLLFVVEIMVAKHFALLAAGEFLNKQFNLKRTSLYTLHLIGLVAYSLLTLIPVVNMIVAVLAGLLGLGAMTQYFKQLVDKQRQK